MCLAKVKLAEESEDAELLMTDVARVEPTEEGLLITDLMGESRTVEATIKSIDFIESIVFLQTGKE